MGDDDYSPQVTSRFHGAFSEIFRLNVLWSGCNEFASAGKLIQWRWKLDAIWRELSASAYKLDETINNVNEVKWRDRNVQTNKKVMLARNRDELYQALNDREEMLRLLQDAAGKGSAWTDESESGFF